MWREDKAKKLAKCYPVENPSTISCIEISWSEGISENLELYILVSKMHMKQLEL